MLRIVIVPVVGSTAAPPSPPSSASISPRSPVAPTTSTSSGRSLASGASHAAASAPASDAVWPASTIRHRLATHAVSRLPIHASGRVSSSGNVAYCGPVTSAGPPAPSTMRPPHTSIATSISACISSVMWRLSAARPGASASPVPGARSRIDHDVAVARSALPIKPRRAVASAWASMSSPYPATSNAAPLTEAIARQ